MKLYAILAGYRYKGKSSSVFLCSRREQMEWLYPDDTEEDDSTYWTPHDPEVHHVEDLRSFCYAGWKGVGLPELAEHTLCEVDVKVE